MSSSVKDYWPYNFEWLKMSKERTIEETNFASQIAGEGNRLSAKVDFLCAFSLCGLLKVSSSYGYLKKV